MTAAANGVSESGEGRIAIGNWDIWRGLEERG
jgi:hypothetical protein